jgi:FixJ family two-component response regulator
MKSSKEEKKVDYILTNKHVIGAIRRSKAIAKAVKAAAHSSVTSGEKSEIDQLIATLTKAEAELSKAVCPNGMQRVVAINASGLSAIGKLLE